MEALDWNSLANRYDRERMATVLERFPTQCQEAVRMGERFEFIWNGSIDKVVVCGMGGSAMAGEVARRFGSVPMFVNRSYTLPVFVDRATLLVAVSYSGNTVETLTAFKQGLEKDVPLFCITSGGRMEEMAKSHEIPLLKIPPGYQPRMALGYISLPLLTVLAHLGLVKGLGSWEALIAALVQIRAKCKPAVPRDENPAGELASALNGRIPSIYGTVDNTDFVAMRWKTQINENAKQLAFWNVIPELDHNEISTLVKTDLTRDLLIILLRNGYDRVENLDRIDTMKELLAEDSIPYQEVTAEGEGALSQIFSQVYFGDYATFYLALLNQIDPTPVFLIERFKRALAERSSRTGEQPL